jgi:putative ABC transport system permease protein
MIRPGIRRLFHLPGRGRGVTREELDEEIRLHLELRVEQLRARGMSEEAAWAEARRRFGPEDEAAAALRRAADRKEKRLSSRSWRHDARRDVGYGARQLLRAPGFAAVGILTLALGIGATTAIFSIVNGVLLKPLPFAEPELLVSLRHQGYSQGPGTFFTYREQNRAFADLGAWEPAEVSVTGRGDPERLAALRVTDRTLPLLRVRPALGRLFTAQDDAVGSPLRVLLTHGYWQRSFGGEREVVGRTLEVDGELAEVIGVLPAGFRFLHTDPSIVLPMRLDPADQAAFDFNAIARLRPGLTVEQANADLARMIPLLPEQYAAFRLRPDIHPLAREVIGEIDRPLWILLGTVCIVLLIACANVANLFLVRAEGRQREIAVRAALGAGRGRIARQLLAESMVLGAAGGVGGLLLAWAGTGLLRRIAPAELPRVEEIGLDARVLLFAIGISLLAGVLCGLLPVLKFGAPSAIALREGGRGASEGPGRHRVRNRLVVAEIALSMMLLVLSALMMRTFLAMRQVEPGFAGPAEIQTFRVSMPPEAAPDAESVARSYERIARRLEQVPGVASVGLSSSITMDGEDNTNPLYVEGESLREGELPPFRRFKSVAPGYFETMGNPVVAGRPVAWDDVHAGRRVVVIAENLAREYWGEPSRAIGRRVRNDPEGPWEEVVGVVGDERDDGLDRPATAIVYWPMMHASYPRSTMAFAVRSSRAGTPAFLRELREAVWSVNPRLPLAAVQTVERIRAVSMARTSFMMVMLGIAAGVALLLGVVGIYAVISYVAAQRTREVGTRMALGAQGSDVRRIFLRHGLSLTLAGIALGLVGSLLLSRAIAAFLFGVRPTDPLTYAVVALGLTAVALLASYLPARRASRLDPVVALRAEG